MQTTLTVGDWSDDGHGKTSSHTFEHNCPDLEAAYVAGSLCLNYSEQYYEYYSQKTVTRSSLDVLAHVAVAYEDSSIPNEIAERLIQHGILPDETDGTYDPFYERDDDDTYRVGDTEGFANLYMLIARLGYQATTGVTFNYRPVKLNEINVGGYGLFW